MKHKIKTRTKQHKKKKNIGILRNGHVMIPVLIMLAIVAGFLATGGFIPQNFSPTTGTPVTIATNIPEQEKSNLQLYTFGIITPEPSPSVTVTKSCGPEDDNGVAVPADCECLDAVINCKGGKPFDDSGKPLTGTIGTPPAEVDILCGSPWAPTDGRFCVAKPVIYLYPTEPTSVNVSVKSEGDIVISDPLYPEGGWKNVTAYPDGKLFYNGKEYRELFYESEVENINKPAKGIVIRKDNLRDSLDSILDQLGLIDTEKTEFLDFWVPKLQSQNTPYIYFSLVDSSEKKRLDDVTIIPKPDTKIEFIVYFKPVDNSFNYDSSLKLPPKPNRVGFVSVEWGGTLDLK